MDYTIRPATITDIPHIVSHREPMFRDMGIPAHFEDMTAATDLWLRHALPSHTYRGWMATTPNGEVAGGGGLVVIPWPPGPITLDPRCGFVFNVDTLPAHRDDAPAAVRFFGLAGLFRHDPAFSTVARRGGGGRDDDG